MKKIVMLVSAVALAAVVLAGCARQEPMPSNSASQSGHSGKLGRSN